MKPAYQAIFISDIHMDRGLPYARMNADGGSDRLKDQSKLWALVGKTAKRKGITDVWVLGDLFNHSRPDAVTLATTAGCLSRLADASIIVRLLSGNHDALNSSTGGRYVCEAFGELGREGILHLAADKPIERGPITFYPVPFSGVELAWERIERARAHKAKIKVLLVHQSISGATHNGWTCDDGMDADRLVAGFNCTLAGHFHDDQRFGTSEEGPCGMYLGAPLHMNFGDQGRSAGFWCVDFFPDGGWEPHFIDGECPHFFELPLDIDDWRRSIPIGVNHDDYVRFVVKASAYEWPSLQPGAERCESEALAAGFRASHRFEPIRDHKDRFSSEDGSTGELGDEALLERYFRLDGVDSRGLDRGELLAAGADLLRRARE